MSAGSRLLVPVLVLRTAAACLMAEGNPEGSSLGIGLLLPPTEAEADSIRRGAELGIEAANRQPGAKIRLVVRGQPGQWGTEGDDAVVLALDEGMQALIAPPAGVASHQVLQVAGRTRIPVVSLCSDSSVTAPGIPWTVRIAPRTDGEAAALFAALRKPGETFRVAAFVPPERAGREAAKDLQAAADGARVTLMDPVRVGPQTDLRPLIQSTLKTEPNLILLWLDPAEAGRLAKALREAGYLGRLGGPSRLFSMAFRKAADAACEHLAVTVPATVMEFSSLREGFARDFWKRSLEAGQASASVPHTNEPPDFMAGLAFDAVAVLADVLRRASDRPVFREFPLTNTLPGVTGPIAFDGSGNRRLPLQVLEIQTNHRFKESAAEP